MKQSRSLKAIPKPKKKTIQWLRKKLLEWHKTAKRSFTWRNSPTPYKVLISEIMLQRTQAKQVEPVYREFLKTFPTPQKLAAAPLKRIKKAIQPLGLLHRAHDIKRMAGELVERHKGEVPSDLKLLKRLQGVGDYVAGAVLCFGFGKDVPIVDANVIRVFDRFWGMKSSKPRPREDRRYWELAAALVPRKKGREFNMALLDFAALICTPRDPKCLICPLADRCKSVGQFRR